MARYINREDVIEEINEAISNISFTSPYQNDIGTMVSGMERVLGIVEDAPISDVVEVVERGYNDGKPKWIPVSERLPELETAAIVYTRYGVIDMFTYRYNKRDVACFMFADDCGYWQQTFDEVTHWMPLPEPPKEV